MADHYLDLKNRHPTVYPYDSTKWITKGKLHRDDSPAFESPHDGYKSWYLNGKRHRLDGPAVKCHFKKEWWINGALHRMDGPAILWADGDSFWFLYGTNVSRT